MFNFKITTMKKTVNYWIGLLKLTINNPELDPVQGLENVEVDIKNIISSIKNYASTLSEDDKKIEYNKSAILWARKFDNECNECLVIN